MFSGASPGGGRQKINFFKAKSLSYTELYIFIYFSRKKIFKESFRKKSKFQVSLNKIYVYIFVKDQQYFKLVKVTA